MTTDPTDEELCVRVALALGWTWKPDQYYIGGKQWFNPSGQKDGATSDLLRWVESADAALELVEAMRDRGCDISTFRGFDDTDYIVSFDGDDIHAKGQAPTLPRAIVRAFLASQGEGK